MKRIRSVEIPRGIRPPRDNHGFGHDLTFFSWRGPTGNEDIENPPVRCYELANGDVLLMSPDGHAIVVPRGSVGFIEPWERGRTEADWMAADNATTGTPTKK